MIRLRVHRLLSLFSVRLSAVDEGIPLWIIIVLMIVIIAVVVIVILLKTDYLYFLKKGKRGDKEIAKADKRIKNLDKKIKELEDKHRKGK